MEVVYLKAYRMLLKIPLTFGFYINAIRADVSVKREYVQIG